MNLTQPKINIYEFRFFKINVQAKNLLDFAKNLYDLTKENADLFTGIPDGYKIFHKSDNIFPVVQIGVQDSYLTITAYGDYARQAVQIWMQIYARTHYGVFEHYQMLTEHYSLQFLDGLKATYEVKTMLVNHELYNSLREISDTGEKKEKLAQYIVNMYFPFFTHLGYNHKEQGQGFEIKAEVIRFRKHRYFYKTFAKASKHAAYGIKFRTNIYLPHIFSIGLAKSLGYGKLYWILDKH